MWRVVISFKKAMLIKKASLSGDWLLFYRSDRIRTYRPFYRYDFGDRLARQCMRPYVVELSTGLEPALDMVSQ